VYVDEKVEVPWSTPQNPIYKGGEPIFVCSKNCYEAFKMNMKEFWHPNGEY
jgi:YHS domain-containing protein